MGTSKIVIEEKHAEEDHPHAYGDKHKSFPVANTEVGSSPRVWGQGSHPSGDKERIRIIPTRMGTRF